MSTFDRSFITVVSGLPRSGTSMMMQMLDAGGLAVMSDGQRTADEDNLKGYYELEAVKRTRHDCSWVQDAVGKAVYRRLHDGRWIVTVSGDGSLGLAHLDPGEPEPELAPPPPVKSYEQVEAELGARIERIGPAQVLRRFSRAREQEPAP